MDGIGGRPSCRSTEILCKQDAGEEVGGMDFSAAKSRVQRTRALPPHAHRGYKAHIMSRLIMKGLVWEIL